jgi:hypothetical protein
MGGIDVASIVPVGCLVCHRWRTAYIGFNVMAGAWRFQEDGASQFRNITEKYDGKFLLEAFPKPDIQRFSGQGILFVWTKAKDTSELCGVGGPIIVESVPPRTLCRSVSVQY